jgi:hypothetical protein
MKLFTIIEQLNNNSFTFYDNKLGSILREFSGFEFPDVQESIDDVAGPYGAVYVNSKFGRRQMTIQGDIVSPDVFTLRRTLSNALRQTGTMKLFKFITYDDLYLQFEGEVVKMVNPYNHQVHTFMIDIVAPDWRFYSQELFSYDIGQTIVRGGISIPSNVPMSLGSPSGGNDAVDNIIVNNGNEVTDPIFTLTGPGQDFSIGNVTTGKTFTLSTVLVGGDTVIIDVRNRTAIKNGITNVYPDLAGDLWSLAPGENELRFFIGSGLTIATNLNFSYRDAYSGI